MTDAALRLQGSEGRIGHWAVLQRIHFLSLWSIGLSRTSNGIQATTLDKATLARGCILRLRVAGDDNRNELYHLLKLFLAMVVPE
jgi:hypothetical protein